MSELVSVVIPCYNREATLPATLASAAAQTWRPLEIVAIDDGSTDGTRSVLDAFARDSDFPVRITSRPNRGVTPTRNEALQQVQGGFVAFLDSDDLWQPGKLEGQMALMRRSARLGLVHTAVEFIDEQSRATGECLDVDPAYRGNWLAAQIRSNNIQTSSVLMRRGACDAVGLFDESLAACEDWDYWIRMARLFDIDFLPARLTRMRQHPGRLTRDVELMRTSHLAVLDKVEHEIGRGDPKIAEALDFGRRRVYRVYGAARLRRSDHVGARHDLLHAFGLPGETASTALLFAQACLPPHALHALKKWLRPGRGPVVE